MNHDDIRELIPAHSLGALDRDERAEVETHLHGCAECRALAADYAELSDRLLYTIPLEDAPAHLADDLRRRIAPAPVSAPAPARRAPARPTARRRAWAALAFALVLLVASNAYWFYRMEQASRVATIHTAAIRALAGAPRATLTGDDPDARGILYYRPEAAVAILRVADLPPLPPDKAYQLWLVYGDQRDSGGVFQLDAEGGAIVLVTAPRPFAEYNAVGITVEPADGSPGPTSPRVIGTALEPPDTL